MKAKDITGNRYGQLTILSKAETAPGGQARWQCRCDCGKEFVIYGFRLRQGQDRCQSCANAKSKNVGLQLNWEQIRKWRRKRLPWWKIASYAGTSDLTLRRWRPEGLRGGRVIVGELKARKIEKGLEEKKPWKDIDGSNGRRLERSYRWALGKRISNELATWSASPHGRVVKALAEGYSVSKGCLRANVGGSYWHRLVAKELPAHVRWMLELPKEKIAIWLEKGATWREINEFLNKPFRFGCITEACYNARLDWDSQLEPFHKEEDFGWVA